MLIVALINVSCLADTYPHSHLHFLYELVHVLTRTIIMYTCINTYMYVSTHVQVVLATSYIVLALSPSSSLPLCEKKDQVHTVGLYMLQNSEGGDRGKGERERERERTQNVVKLTDLVQIHYPTIPAM